MSYYKNIFKNLPFPCLLFEKRKDVFVIREANSIYCKVTNIDGRDLKGKLIVEVFPENPLSSGLKQIQESLEIAYISKETHKIDSLRYDLYDAENGIYELKYWKIENTPIFDDAKNIWYILNVVKDITTEILERDRYNLLQVTLDAKTEKHEQIIEKITDGLFSLDKEGNFISLNKGLIDIAETPETDLLKMNFLPFCGEDHREEIVKYFNAAIKGENQNFEANFISGKGRKLVLEISLVPLKNDGIITGLYGIAKDITRLKESEVALLRSERKFKALVQEGSDLIGILDPEGNYKFISETSSSLLGMNPMEFVGKSAYDFVHPEDRERVIKDYSGLEPKNQIQIKPFRFKNTHGEWRWVETKATNRINDPAIEGIITNSRDVTDHINSQKAIKESEERYRSFYENSQDGILLTAPDGRIFAANTSACRMFQRTEKELCKVGRAGVVHLSDPRLAHAIKERNSTGKVLGELNLIRKDGSIFPAALSSAIFEDANGDRLTSIIIRDISEAKLAEQKLKASETEYRKLFENSPLPSIIYEMDTFKILELNKAAIDHYDYTRAEFLQMTILDFLPEEDILILKNTISTLSNKEGEVSHNSNINLKKDGERILVETFGYSLQYKEKNCRLIICLDITEKEAALQKLKEKTEKLMSAEKLAKLGYWEIGLQEQYFYWSDEVYRIWGRKKEEFQVGLEEFEKTIHPEDLENFRLQQLLAINETKEIDYEHRIILPNKEIKWVHQKGKLIKDKEGKPLSFEGSVQDITIIKKSELEALKASEEKENILESIGDAFFRVDNEWIVTYWNRHSETLLDCPKDKILGKNVWEVFPDAIDTKFYTSYQKAVTEKSIQNFEEYFARGNKWFEVSAYPSHNGLSIYFRDVTERKETELEITSLNNNMKAYTEELVEANKGLEQFSFIVSHNLRSPVANILGLADLIGNEEYSQEVKNNFLDVLLNNVKRLDMVITDLNAILQVKVDMDAKKEPVILNNLIDAIKTSIQNLIEKEEVKITTHFNIPAIHSVQSYLHSIFYNLIANSIKYRQPGVAPQIGIKSETKEESVVITFEDNGLGIDLAKKGEQIFGLYRRFHHHIEGKGMGLFLVKTQVEMLGGKIAIDSEVNAGTKFTITFNEKSFTHRI